MNFEAVEDDIVAALQVKITDPDTNIIPIPEDEVEILPAFGKRQIIVAFSNEDADPDENTSVVEQNTQITMACLLQGKKLRGTAGLYALAELVKLTLIGFKPTDCRELTYSSHKFIKNDKKIFEYLVEFKTNTTRVQDITEPTGPSFQGATFIPVPTN